jgi:hypothetical protein
MKEGKGLEMVSLKTGQEKHDVCWSIQYSDAKQEFQDTLRLTGVSKSNETRAIMDTGATISIVDLEYAIELGAELVGMRKVVGVDLIPALIYLVKLNVSVVHEESGKKPLTFAKDYIMGASPHFWKGGDQLITYLHVKDSEAKSAIPLLDFAVGFPGGNTALWAKILSGLVVRDGHVVIERLKLQGIGVPLLVGCDIMKDLANAGYPIEFKFQSATIQKFTLDPL